MGTVDLGTVLAGSRILGHQCSPLRPGRSQLTTTSIHDDFQGLSFRSKSLGFAGRTESFIKVVSIASSLSMFSPSLYPYV